MKSVFYIAMLVLSACLALSDDMVTQLTDASWDDAQGIWMVKFYAPWCGHCKKFAPIFVKASEITSQTEGYIQFGEIDCDANKDVCSKYHVTGYPTTLLLFNGKLIANYRESRNAAQIKSWIIKNLNPTHLRDADIVTDEEIDAMVRIKSNYQNNKGNTDPAQRTQNRGSKFSSKGQLKMPWEFSGFSDLYYYVLGDTHPTIPFIIYVIGTLSGVCLGVCFVLCAGN